MAGGTILAPKIQKPHEPRAKSTCFHHETLPNHPKPTSKSPLREREGGRTVGAGTVANILA